MDENNQSLVKNIVSQVLLRLILFVVIGIFFVSASISVYSFPIILYIIYPFYGAAAHLSQVFQFLFNFVGIFLSSILVFSIGVPVSTRNALIRYIKKYPSSSLSNIVSPKMTRTFFGGLFVILVTANFQSFVGLFSEPAVRTGSTSVGDVNIIFGFAVIVFAIALSALYGAIFFHLSLKKYVSTFSNLSIDTRGESLKYFSLLSAVGLIFSLLPIFPVGLAPIPISLLGVGLCIVGMIHILISKKRVGKKMAIIGGVLGVVMFSLSFYSILLVNMLSTYRMQQEMEARYPTINQLIDCNSRDLFYYKDLSGAVKNPEKVCAFVADKENLSLIPEEVRQFKNIRDLHLSRNSLSTLPPWLHELSSIQWLDLSDNNFMTFSDEIYKLPGLKVLVLSGNLINQSTLDTITAKLPGVDVRYERAPSEQKIQEQVQALQKPTYELTQGKTLKEFYDPATGFRFSYPKEWKEVSTPIPGDQQLILRPLRDDNNTITINIAPKIKGSVSIDTLLHLPTSQTTAGGVVWKLIPLEDNASDLNNKDQNQIIASYEDAASMTYSIDALYEKKNATIMKDAFTKVLSSVQFK